MSVETEIEEALKNEQLWSINYDWGTEESPEVCLKFSDGTRLIFLGATVDSLCLIRPEVEL